MRRLRLAAPLALLLAGCQTDQQAAPSAQPPDARAAIVAAKGLLYKDPDSIKGASITAPRRHMGFMWHVCVRANAKNAFGGYTGERDMLIGLYDDGKPPSVIMANGAGYCDFPHEPFHELDGGYQPPKQAGKPKA